MSARTLVVGLDGLDPGLAARWCAEGHLPRLRDVAERAAEFDLVNQLGTIGGGVWQELNSGRSCGRTGIFHPARQLHSGESVPRQVRREEVDTRAYWTVASDAGKRVAVVDAPQSVPPPELNGVMVTEWGAHDRFYGPQSIPPGLEAELTGRHGSYPLWLTHWSMTTTACDGHDGTTEQYEQLLDDLLAGADMKTDLVLDVLGREDWDMFVCAFSEAHCSGHQLWHFLDGSAPVGHERLAEGIKLVYERVDAALGRVIDGAGPGATVFVVASHPFAPPSGGPQLIPEVLVRLGYGSASGMSSRARSKIPPVVRRSIRRMLPSRTRESLLERTGALENPLESPHTRAVAIEGDSHTWIRLNLAGREPHGSVQQGSEAEEILAEIRSELLLLEHPDLGVPIVDKVVSAEEAFGAEHHRDIPDLMVGFRKDLGVLDACQSSRVGLVRVPYVPVLRRTSGHPPLPSRLWIEGPSVQTPGSARGGEAVDLAATILAQLGVPQPAWLDGVALA